MWKTPRLLCAGLLIGAATLAMPLGAMPSAAGPPVPSNTLDDGDLLSFAAAYLAVEKIRAEFESRTDDPTLAEDRQSLHQAAGEKMADAIEARGLKVAEYQQIALAVQRDPAVRKKVLDYIDRLR